MVGCGPSADPSATYYADYWTVGCNRSVRFCRPDFAICVEPPRDREVWGAIRDSSPLVVFSHVATRRDGTRLHPRVVAFDETVNAARDVRPWLTGCSSDPDDPLRLEQSPFYAAAAAALLGFERIGLVGVDLTADRYGDNTMRKSEAAWSRLNRITNGRIVNLSSQSRLEAIPRAELDEIRPKI